jgi:hypothetical protein
LVVVTVMGLWRFSGVVATILLAIEVFVVGRIVKDEDLTACDRCGAVISGSNDECPWCG